MHYRTLNHSNSSKKKVLNVLQGDDKFNQEKETDYLIQNQPKEALRKNKQRRNYSRLGNRPNLRVFLNKEPTLGVKTKH